MKIVYAFQLLLVAATAFAKNNSPIVSATGNLGSGSPYSVVHVKYVTGRLARLELRAGDVVPSCDATDADKMYWSYALPVDLEPEDWGRDDTYVTFVPGKENSQLSVQQYKLTAGRFYQFRVCAWDAEGKAFVVTDFFGTPIDD